MFRLLKGVKTKKERNPNMHMNYDVEKYDYRAFILLLLARYAMDLYSTLLHIIIISDDEVDLQYKT